MIPMTVSLGVVARGAMLSCAHMPHTQDGKEKRVMNDNYCT